MTKSSSALPTDVRRFVVTSIPSVPFAEALLLFHRRQAEAMGLREVAQDLYMTETAAARVIDALAAAGFIDTLDALDAADPRKYRYAVAARHAATVDRFAVCYRTQLVEVARLIHERPAPTP